MISSFNGLHGPGGLTECCPPQAIPSRECLCGIEIRAESSATRGAAVSRDGVVKSGDELRGLLSNSLSFRQSFCGYGSTLSSASAKGSHRHKAKFGSLRVRVSSSKEDGYGSKSDELPSKARSVGKKTSKASKQRAAREDGKKISHVDVGKGEGLLVEPDSVILKTEPKVDELRAMDEVNGSWTDADKHEVLAVLNKLEALRLHVLALEQWHGSLLTEINRKFQRSARNLLHYVAIKTADLQDMQLSLPKLGLPDFKEMEGHVVASLTQSICVARALSMFLSSGLDVYNAASNNIWMDKKQLDSSTVSSGKDVNNSANNRIWMDKKQLDRSTIVRADASNRTTSVDTLPPLSVERSKLQLTHNTVALFGPRPSRKAYIMVTLSEEMVENETLVVDLMKAGMDIARINCAHGSPEAWGHIIQTVKHCSQMLEKPCRVLMDLAGPKLRTSAFPPGPCVQKIKPQRDGLGNVVLPARIWLALPGTPVPEGMSADAVVPVKGDDWLGSLQVGDKLRLQDGRGKPRQFIITDKSMGPYGIGCWAECFQTTYLQSGTKLELVNKRGRLSKGYVEELPPLEHFIKLKKGDALVLTKESTFPVANESETNEAWIYRLQVSHTFGKLFESVKPGEPIRFDDGRIEGIVRGVTSSDICLQVTFANEKGSKLGGEKSINLPNSNLSQKGLTIKDMVDLDFVIGHADMVALSFVNNAQDVLALQEVLKRKGAINIGVVLKIETRDGVVNLPEILLQGMKIENPLGVMIARGDLAVECGWESMAGLQEEILQMCKAAHVPTIWATQVLESLTKQGLPTRPEITDAALGGRATCVMLNKGSHIVKAVSTLDRILNTAACSCWEGRTRNVPLGLSGLAND